MTDTHAWRTTLPIGAATRTRPDGLVTDWGEAAGECRTATFDPTRTYRYALTRIWSLDRSLVAFVMLNPSTADAFQTDPTVRRCIRYALDWQAGGLLVLNLFALRATDPDQLYTHPDPIGPANDQIIAEHLYAENIHRPPVSQVIAAWGAHGTHRSRGLIVAATLRQHDIPLWHLGLTDSGHPRHPLYLPSHTTPQPLNDPAGP